MKVRDIMTTEVATVTPATLFKEVVERLLGRDVSGLPVVDGDDQLVGVITEADLISKEGYDYPGRRRRSLSVLADVVSGRQHHWVSKASGATAGDLMTKTVITCAPTDDARQVARQMLTHGVKRLPVVDNSRLVGIVSRRDILALFDRDDQAVATDVRRRLDNPLYSPEESHIQLTVQNGVVTLEGDVPFEGDVPMVGEIVSDVPGVVDVVNHLTGREPDPKPPFT